MPKIKTIDLSMLDDESKLNETGKNRSTYNAEKNRLEPIRMLLFMICVQYRFRNLHFPDPSFFSFFLCERHMASSH